MRTRIFGLTIDNRRKRRLFIVVMYAAYVAACAFAHVDRGSWAGVAAASFGSALAAAALGFCWLALVQLTREYGFPGDSRTNTGRDERHDTVRHHAFVHAYWILTAILCAAIMCSVTAGDSAIWRAAAAHRTQAGFGLILLVTTLPSAVLAWSEPDEPFEAA